MSFPIKESSRFWGAGFVTNFYGDSEAEVAAATRRRVANLQTTDAQRRAINDRRFSFVINPNKEKANDGKRVEAEAIE
ncbi:hypothetical protein ACEPUD_06315 [Burkholderia ubonensis]|uniref:hypothetical protein n=1 Tax=Burkholderia ubonensis TaxID=101571 RepID=UPI00358F3006